MNVSLEKITLEMRLFGLFGVIIDGVVKQKCFKKCTILFIFILKIKIIYFFNELRIPLDKSRKRNLIKNRKTMRDKNGNVVYQIQIDKPINDNWRYLSYT